MSNPAKIVISLCVLLGSPLASAAELADLMMQEKFKAAAVLLDQPNADVAATQPDDMTALHWAVYHDQAELARRILDAGANVNAQNRYGVSPIMIACQNGNEEIARALLKAGANANDVQRGGETVLMTAARTGKVDVVTRLVEHGAEVNAVERRQQTALMWAAADGHADVVAFLIQAGADFRRRLPSGFTALFFAVRNGHSDVALTLLDAGEDVNDRFQPEKAKGNSPKAGTTPLILAVENGHFELAVQLLDKGADPNLIDCGYSALHALTWVRKPIRGDGDPPPLGSGAMTSLEMVRQLVSHSAELNIRHGKHGSGSGRLDRTDATPFFLAAETGDLALLKLLVELGANPHFMNAQNCTALLAACGVGVLSDGDESAGTEEDAIATVLFLLEHGLDINAVDDNGMTVMHGAAYKSWDKLVLELASRGAVADTWNRKNKLGRTPLEIAEGHRPGNFRPSETTMTALLQCLKLRSNF
ncbi:MAG: ankyrin repeat domain-containing protein [Pirellulaceae bacterium]